VRPRAEPQPDGEDVADGVVADKKVGRVAAGATMCGNGGILADQDRRFNQRAHSNRLWCRSVRNHVRIGQIIRGKSKLLLRKRDDLSFIAPMRTYLFDDEDGDGLSLLRGRREYQLGAYLDHRRR
jgi:hypothetical protein